MAANTITAQLAERLDSMRLEAMPPEAITVAKQCLMDWLGVAFAGRNEPLTQILVEELVDGQTPGGVAIVGWNRRAPVETATLINGAMSHALDFDDVILGMGHPTAPVAPVVFALSEQLGASGSAALEAFIVGVEAECRVASLMGRSHYGRGWHGTATFGAFGAAAAACRLLGANGTQLVHALGLAGTQAAGLKSAFGSMTKPLHAGKAAQNGLLAARLAARGFTADADILGSPQGFAAVQSSHVDPSRALGPIVRPRVLDALFKYHAACYLTHNAIEAALRLRQAHRLQPDQIDRVEVHVGTGHLNVCNIEVPTSGLECKFSLRMTTALALAGEDTSNEAVFSDATVAREDLRALSRRIFVIPDAIDGSSKVEVVLRSGERFVTSADVGVPDRDLARQHSRLTQKFALLLEGGIEAGQVRNLVDQLAAFETLERADGPLVALSAGRR